jgi:hypothetical protein
LIEVVRIVGKESKDKCEICGENLEYAINIVDYRDLACVFCGKKGSVNIYCPNGHYICDGCHAKDPLKVIEDFCENAADKNPYILADKIMKHPKFKVYGPEHHALVPAVVLTILKNNGIKKPSGQEITLFDIKEATRRGSKIPGGWCGFYGTCGAGVGSGVAISIFTNASPSTDKPRTLATLMTSKSLEKIADNLEHCCKRSVKISITEVLKFLNKEFDVNLDFKESKCKFSGINDKCEMENCPIF